MSPRREVVDPGPHGTIELTELGVRLGAPQEQGDGPARLDPQEFGKVWPFVEDRPALIGGQLQGVRA